MKNTWKYHGMTINPDNDLHRLHSFKIINSTYLTWGTEYKYD